MWQCHCHPNHLEKYGPKEPGETLPRSKYLMTVTALRIKTFYLCESAFGFLLGASPKSSSLGQFPTGVVNESLGGPWVLWTFWTWLRQIWLWHWLKIWLWHWLKLDRLAFQTVLPGQTREACAFLKIQVSSHWLNFAFIAFYRQICRRERSKSGLHVALHLQSALSAKPLRKGLMPCINPVHHLQASSKQAVRIAEQLCIFHVLKTQNIHLKGWVDQTSSQKLAFPYSNEQM